MIYLNCNQLPSSCRLASTENRVVFDNVKTEYRGDEDITIKYILDSETEASSRNWIGLYPKGATLLDQYITFEWTIVNPSSEDLKHQRITFYAKYHMKNVEANKEYFFVFVNKQMKAVGSSPYFQFLFYHTLEIEDLKVPEKLRTNDCSTPESLKSFSEENMKMSMMDDNCKEILQRFHYQTDHSKHCQMHTSNIQMSDSISHNISSFKADTLTSPDYPISINSSLSNNDVHCCALCKRPANFAAIEQRLNDKVKMYAEYGHTLEKRIEELEKNFEMSQVAQKQLKLIAYHAKREKSSYQKFVNEMLSVLSNKGAVRILGGHGTELLLKRVDPTQAEGKGASLMSRKSHREEMLKSVISSQENTIRELLAKLENYSQKEKENILEIQNEFTAHDIVENNTKQMKTAGENSVTSLNTLSHLENVYENHEEKEKHIEKVNDTLNESIENNSVEHILNETYSIENTCDPVSVILPIYDYGQPKKQQEGCGTDTKKIVVLNSDGQGDFHRKSTLSKENIHDIKQNVIKELRSAIQKRQDKSEGFKNPSDTISNESFNLSINETVQSMSVDEPNALIIKGERLQYAIIRIQQSP